eukprot:4731779-Lingulodinium_polyedra.AAC.1
MATMASSAGSGTEGAGAGTRLRASTALPRWTGSGQPGPTSGTALTLPRPMAGMERPPRTRGGGS